MSVLYNQIKILKNSLEAIASYGWAEESLRLGAIKARLNPDIVPLIFENGGKSAHELFVYMINNKLLKKASHLKNTQLRTHEKIEECILIRLELLSPYKSVVERTHFFQINPKSTCSSLKLLYTIVDTIWFLAGDNSTDWNYYTKRTLLAYAYLEIIKKWSNFPGNMDIEDLRLYIQDRLRAAMRLGTIKKKITSFF